MRKKFLMTLALGLILTLTPVSALADPEVKAPATESESVAESEEDSEAAPEATEDAEASEGEGIMVLTVAEPEWRTETDTDGIEHKYYYVPNEEGTLVKASDCMLEIDGKTYLFDEKGDLGHGFYGTTESGKSIVFADAEGVVFEGTGWAEIDGDHYYMKDGHLQLAEDGLTGVFTEQINTTDGEGNPIVVDAQRAWVLLEGDWYLLDAETGARLSGWQDAKSATYYLNPENEDKMEVGDNNGWKLIDGDWYNFQSWGGIRKDGWFYHKGWWYYLHPDGKMQAGGNLFYKGYDYFFYSWGGMYHDSFVTYDGDVYYTLNWGGAARDAWSQSADGIYHWQGSDGKMVKNCDLDYKGCRYRIDENGNMLANAWRQIGKDYYWYLSWGGMAKSQWISYKGHYYYLDKNGVMMHDRWLDPSQPDNTNPSNLIYYLQSWGGRCASGTYIIGGKSYVFDTNGRRTVAGYFMQNGYRYYRMEDGSICYNLVKVDPSYVQSCSKVIYVDRARGITTVYGYYNGSYNTPLISMYCSVGLPTNSTQTWLGDFHIGWKKTVKKMVGADYVCWAPYVCQFNDTIYFHGVASNTPELDYISQAAFEALGTPQSHGCVRLAACEAKWIYQYVRTGTPVYVRENCANPLPNPVRYAWTGGAIGSDPTYTPLSASDFVCG